MPTLRFNGCRVPIENQLGAPGEGFKVAMATLDVFRPTVAAAALGLAQRAFDEMVRRSARRRLFGQLLADFQLTQAALADSAIDIEAAALLIYQAAWKRDCGTPRITREASMAKAFATEMAQRVIDRAVQIFGGNGVRVGSKVEALYREIRAMRIYEGATEIQKLIVARELMKAQARTQQQAAE
jgi:acyl-CoA dehydrogenase